MMDGCRTPLLLLSVFYSCFYFLFCTNTVEAFLVLSESRTTSSSPYYLLNTPHTIIIQPLFFVTTLRTQYLYHNQQQQSSIRTYNSLLLYLGGQNQEVPNKADNNSADSTTTARRRSVSSTDTLSSNRVTSTTTTTTNKNKNELETVTSFTERAIYRYGSEEGLHALRELNKLCQRRLSYHFPDNNPRIEKTNQKNDDNHDTHDQGERVISLLPNLLPAQVINDFLESVRYMEKQNGWISTNPDSVDGRPSLHVNLVSDAKPFFHQLPSGSSFQSHIQQLYDLIRPYVYENLYQEVERLLNHNNNNNNSGSKLRVSDIFLRRYGEYICGDVTRNSISMHYDVFSRITAVIALDEVASQGTNGLFTFVSVDDDDSGDDIHGRQAPTTSSSSHKALRRYFPLNTGDCVVHTWDVLHGVDVEPGLDRTSLIVWFDEEPINNKNNTNNTNNDENDDESDNDNNTNNDNNNDNDNEDQKENGMVAAPILSPWLFLEHRQNTPNNRTTLEDGNDVRQFVLASALASSSSSSSIDNTNTTSITTTTTNTTTTTTTQSEQKKKEEEIRLYLRSAAQRNTFALTRMGSLCEEGTLVTCGLDDVQQEAFSVVEQLRPFYTLPLILQEILQQQHDDDSSFFELACRFWFEAAVQGNSLAQKALADEVMFVASQSGDANQRLFAAVLFALASQQEDDDTTGTTNDESSSSSTDSLSRVIQYDSAARQIESQEEFLASPVVQVAQASGFDF